MVSSTWGELTTAPSTDSTQALGAPDCSPLPARPTIEDSTAKFWLDLPGLKTKQPMGLRAQGDFIHVLGSKSPILINQKDNTICTFEPPKTGSGKVKDALFVNNNQELVVSFAPQGATAGFVGSYILQGTQWRPSSLESSGGSRIIAHSPDKATLFGTFGSGSLHRSTDYGESWVSVFNDESEYTPLDLKLDRNAAILWATYIGAPDRVALRWFDTQDLLNPQSQGGGIEAEPGIWENQQVIGVAPDAHRDMTLWVTSSRNKAPTLGRVRIDAKARSAALKITPFWMGDEKSPLLYPSVIWTHPSQQDAIVVGGQAKAPGGQALAFINAQGSAQYLGLPEAQAYTIKGIVDADQTPSAPSTLAVLADTDDGAKLYLAPASI